MENRPVAYSGKDDYIFISYAHKDASLVLPLICGLMDRGFRVWYDEGIEISDNFADVIARRLIECGCVLCFVSEGFLNSENCLDEIAFAREYKKRTMLVYLESVSLSPEMQLKYGRLNALKMDNFPDAQALLEKLASTSFLHPCMFPQELRPDEMCMQGVNALDKKNYTEAFNWFRKAADAGNVAAQYNMGVCYASGFGVSQNDTQAFEWYLKAAQQNFPAAQNTLAICFESGTGVDKDSFQAAYWFRRAAELGDAHGQYNLACFLKNGTGCPIDLPEALEWFHKAASQGFPNAQLQAKALESLLYGQKNLTAEEMCQLGQDAFQQQNYFTAAQWYEGAAQLGDPIAQNNLALCLHKGLGVSQDDEKSVFWLEKAASQGHAGAQYTLGYCLRYGIGTPRNPTEAKAWYEKAAAQDYADASEGVAAMELELQILQKYTPAQIHELSIAAYALERYDEAMLWLNIAAWQGNADSQHDLALCYMHGLGVAQNPEKAVSLIQKAAAQDHVGACYLLGLCYRDGIILPKSRETAMELFQRAANRGHVEAQQAYEQLQNPT